jgi:hypothetical protein
MVHLSTTPVVRDYLEALVASGLYGKSIAEAAERLVGRGIEGLIHEGALKRAGDKGKRSKG